MTDPLSVEDADLLDEVETVGGRVGLVLVDTAELLEVDTQGPQGIPGPQGPQGAEGPIGGISVMFSFVDATTVWTINHGWGEFPSITRVAMLNGLSILPEIEWPDLDTVVISHDNPMAGYVWLRRGN